MSFELQSHQWPARRAVLLVHGIGNAKPGDYTQLVGEVNAALGAEADNTVIYQLWYDQVNDWFAAKTDLAHLISVAVKALATRIDDSEIGEVIAESAGDVLWPVLSANARAAAREAFLAWLARHSYRLTSVDAIRDQFARHRRIGQLVRGVPVDWLQEHSDREGVPTEMAFRPDPEYQEHIKHVPTP